jgi:hypothetical protein
MRSKFLMALVAVVASSLFVSVGSAAAQKLKFNCNETNIPNRNAVCAKDVPPQIRYCPTVRACDGKAAAILSGIYKNSFSVVLRTIFNEDRVPRCGSSPSYGGCSRALCETGNSICSAAKVFRVIRKPDRSIYCFRERGDSTLFKRISRMTIKRTNAASSLVRVQLKGLSPRRALNRQTNDPDCKKSKI